MHAASLILPLAAVAGLATAAPTLYPGDAPGKAKAAATATGATLGNAAFTATYAQKGDSITFGGLKAADGTPLLQSGSALFTIRLQDGREFSSQSMRATHISVEPLKADKEAVRGAERVKGQMLHASFISPESKGEPPFRVLWQAELRDGSHYLRQKLSIATTGSVAIKEVTALDYTLAPQAGKPALSGNTTHGRVVVSDKLFFGLETPMSLMAVGSQGLRAAAEWTPEGWQAASFGAAFNLPSSFREAYGDAYAAADGPILRHLKLAEGPVRFAEAGDCTLTFRYTGGNHKLNIVGVQLLDKQGKTVSEDVHRGSTGHASKGNAYTVRVPEAGTEYTLRYWVETKTESIASKGRIELSTALAAAEESAADESDERVRGIWQREAPLVQGEPWSVTGVVGLFAPGQQRRSFLAYVERERAVPYHPFIHYNDWYEIGIRVHDFKDPEQRTNEAMWLTLLDTWNRELNEKRHTKLDGFIVDDGWDEFNSLWDFHCGFPNGFAKMAELAAKQGAGLGTWLGPVGGYGASKQMRLASWNHNHPGNKINNFRLSNKEYFDAFVGRCRQMIRDYGMRYFKFDGISTKFHAKGPANIEDAEGILRVIAALREEKPDIFINATVGTWASPFWYFHADSVWRQENDFDRVGNAGDNRDRWITYRDRLVHEVFVEGAPLFPINSLMVHGTIITKNGPPKCMSREPENCRKEMRMAFGSGSALQEIYTDTDLLCQEGGVLWDELARCIAWVRRNADVLPDTHWVGGNPWDGKDGAIYGYAAWNGRKATLTLRNSSASEKTLRTTLREVLDVPPGVKGTVTFRNSFDDQRELGLTEGALDVDAPLTITMKPLELIVLEGACKM